MCLHYIYELLNDLNNIMSANTLDLLTDYIYSFSLSVQPKHAKLKSIQDCFIHCLPYNTTCEE